MPDKVTLYVGTEAYEGWETVSIQRSLMALCGSFQITLADRQTGRDWRFATQQDCTVQIGADRVLTGFIDRVDLAVGDRAHTVTIAGRDRTADLVDCAAVADAKGSPFPGTLRQTDLFGVARQLLAPYGMVPVAGPGAAITPKFRRFAVQRGESAFEALDRACKQRGLLAITDPHGKPVLTASGSTRAGGALRYGQNLKSARVSHDYTNRFRLYRLETQVAGEGAAVGSVWGQTAEVSASFEDQDVARFRPTILAADADSTREAAKRRAASEALYRAAASHTFEVDVAGWRQADGSLWAVNQVVPVSIPPLYVDEDLLIVDVNLQQSRDGGSFTVLKLMRKDAFDAARAIEAQAIKDPPGLQTHWNRGGT